MQIFYRIVSCVDVWFAVGSAAANATCSTRCWVQPCWGPGDAECVRCPEYRHNVSRVCLQSCDEQPSLYADLSTAAQKQCRPCDAQCLNGCNASVRRQLLSVDSLPPIRMIRRQWRIYDWATLAMLCPPPLNGEKNLAYGKKMTPNRINRIQTLPTESYHTLTR